MIKHYRIRVIGEVQGVWYRKSAQQKALDLNIKGFVQNRLDWSVYIEAEGETKQLEEFLDWCARGPEYAIVENVIKKEGDLQNYTGFEIL